MRKLLTIVFLLVTVHLFAQTSDAYKKTDDSLKNKDYQLAYDNYTLAIKNSTHDKLKLSDLYYQRGMTLRELNNYSAALKDFNEAIELNPQNGSVYWERGIVYDKNKDFKDALSDYKKAMTFINKDDKNNLSVLYCNIAQEEIKLNDLTGAMKSDSIAIALYGDNSRSYEIKGDINQAQRNFSEALENYNKAIYSFIGDNKISMSYLYVQRANIETALKHYKDAINDYTTALNLNPKNRIAYWNRAGAYHYNSDYKLATNDYTTAISFYNGDNINLSKLYENKASNEIGQSLLADAIKDDSIAISLDSNDIDAYYGKASAYTQNGDYKAGIDNYNKLISVAKDKKIIAILYYEVANNEYFLNEFDKVIADCTKAIDLNPGYAESYYYRAKVYLKKMNNKDRATQDFNKVIALDTTKKTVGYIFSLFYIGKADEAVDVLNSEILSTNNDAVLLSDYYNMACLYSLMNKPDEANIYLKKAIDNGYAKKYVIADEDLDNIRNTDDYKAIMTAKPAQ